MLSFLRFTVAVHKRRRLTTVKLRCLGFDGGGGDDVTQYVTESRRHWDNFYERHQNKVLFIFKLELEPS